MYVHMHEFETKTNRIVYMKSNIIAAPLDRLPGYGYCPNCSGSSVTSWLGCLAEVNCDCNDTLEKKKRRPKSGPFSPH